MSDSWRAGLGTWGTSPEMGGWNSQSHSGLLRPGSGEGIQLIANDQWFNQSHICNRTSPNRKQGVQRTSRLGNTTRQVLGRWCLQRGMGALHPPHASALWGPCSWLFLSSILCNKPVTVSKVQPGVLWAELAHHQTWGGAEGASGTGLLTRGLYLQWASQAGAVCGTEPFTCGLWTELYGTPLVSPENWRITWCGKLHVCVKSVGARENGLF